MKYRLPLNQIGLLEGTDKSSAHHNYLNIYERYFEPFQSKPTRLIELGVGGERHPDRGGQSLRMWAQWFDEAEIIGIDIFEKNLPGLPVNVKILKGSQDDNKFLNGVVEQYGQPHIVIDDASHINPLTIASFKILFPLLLPGGIYVIEDIESSWATGWAMGTTDYMNHYFPSIVNFCRGLIDNINAQYIPHYRNSEPFDIESIHFYKNIIFILKKQQL